MTRFKLPALLITVYLLAILTQYLAGHYAGADMVQAMFPHDHVKEPGALRNPFFWVAASCVLLACFLNLFFDEPVLGSEYRLPISWAVSFALCVSAVVGLSLFQNVTGWVIVIMDACALPAMAWRIRYWLTDEPFDYKSVLRDAGVSQTE